MSRSSTIACVPTAGIAAVKTSTSAPLPMSERAQRFAALYRREHPVVLVFAIRRCPNGLSQAEDIANDVFLIAWRRLDEIPTDEGEARGWLLATTRNQLRNLVRNEARRGRFLNLFAADVVPVMPPPDAAIIAQNDLASAWQQLSTAEQEVIALTVLDELTSPQAATVLGISAAAYRTRLNRARNALRKAITATE